jgi:hypothetical protein
VTDLEHLLHFARCGYEIKASAHGLNYNDVRSMPAESRL